MSASFRVGLLFVICAVGVLYVLQVSAISSKGYEINELEKQLQNLKQENEQLEFSIATNRSMQSIQGRLKGLDLVVEGNPEYVVLAGTAVAKR